MSASLVALTTKHSKKIVNSFKYSLITKQIKFIIINAVILVFFLCIYITLFYVNKDEHFTYDKSYNLQSAFDMLYFATITQYTIGYGDVAPRSKVCKFIVIIHMIVAFMALGLLSFE